MKKCYICGKKVKNKNINKDGNYFCSNDCEAEYWHMSKAGCDENRLKNPDVKTMLAEIMLHHNLLGGAWEDFHKDVHQLVEKYYPIYKKGLKQWFLVEGMRFNI